MKLAILFLLISLNSIAQKAAYTLLKADRVFDGNDMHTGWSVLIKGNIIEAVGTIKDLPVNTSVITLDCATIMPGMIEGHSHLFLHPYNETVWDEQVLHESRTERTARAINHAKSTLLAGFTMVRDLGTEGAMYDDAVLKATIEKGIVTGPRMIVATRAIVAKGTYAPKSKNPDLDLPQGAAEVGNTGELVQEVRTQISKGADLIKIYADFGWGLNRQTAPTFTIEEIAAAVLIAKSSGRQVVAHATSAEGMRRACMAGVSVIEHGDEGTAEVFALMKEKNVAYCPTLSAEEAVATYKAVKEGMPADSAGINQKKKSFSLALKAGVTICMGGDVGVFTHGDNAREMEAMAKYGMPTIEVLRSSTSVNAKVFGYGAQLGMLRKGMLADIIAIDGDPSKNIGAVKKILLVMKDGVIYKRPAGQ